MVALIDLDSKLYAAVYRIVSFSQMREAIGKYGKEVAKQWLLQEVYNEGINRLENDLLKTQEYLQSIFFEEIKSYELYITTCSNNFRNKISDTYKKNRKRNKYVWLLREHYIHNGAFFSDTLEADDLIADKVKEIGIGNCIIVSPDKDLKTCGGYYWSYYRQNAKDFNGNLVLNEYGMKEKEFKQKEVVFLSKKDADYCFYQQMLLGDSADNIKGIKGIGLKRSEKLLKPSNNYFITVAREYLKREMKSDFRINERLLRLGE